MCTLLKCPYCIESSGAEVKGPDPVVPIVEVFNLLFGCLFTVCQALIPECAVVFIRQCEVDADKKKSYKKSGLIVHYSGGRGR